jgi:hypothetical protein
MALAGAACKENVRLQPELVSVTPDEIAIDVKAVAGMRVDTDTVVDPQRAVVAGPDGTAHIVIPRERWKTQPQMLQLAGEKESVISRASAHADLWLPVNPAALLRIPPASDGAWLAVVGGGRSGSGSQLSDADDFTSADLTLWMGAADPKLRLVVATPPDAKLEVVGRSFPVAPSGLSEIEIDAEVVFLGISMETLAREEDVRLTLPLHLTREKVTRDESFELTLSKSRPRGLKWLLGGLETRLRNVDKTPIPAASPVVDALLLVTYDRGVLHLGAGGRAGQARWVAVEHATQRSGGVCAFTHFSLDLTYNDVDVVVHDARSGAKVASESFRASAHSCPSHASNDDVLSYRPTVESITAWLESGRKKGWK